MTEWIISGRSLNARLVGRRRPVPVGGIGTCADRPTVEQQVQFGRHRQTPVLTAVRMELLGLFRFCEFHSLGSSTGVTYIACRCPETCVDRAGRDLICRGAFDSFRRPSRELTPFGGRHQERESEQFSLCWPDGVGAFA